MHVSFQRWKRRNSVHLGRALGTELAQFSRCSPRAASFEAAPGLRASAIAPKHSNRGVRICVASECRRLAPA